MKVYFIIILLLSAAVIYLLLQPPKVVIQPSNTTELKHQVEELKHQVSVHKVAIDSTHKAYALQLQAYHSKPPRKRTEQLAAIDTGIVILNDTTAQLNMAAIDSINKLGIAYRTTVSELGITKAVVVDQDSIIQKQQVIITTDSAAFTSTQQAQAKQIKALKLQRAVLVGTSVLVVVLALL